MMRSYCFEFASPLAGPRVHGGPLLKLAVSEFIAVIANMNLCALRHRGLGISSLGEVHSFARRGRILLERRIRHDTHYTDTERLSAHA